MPASDHQPSIDSESNSGCLVVLVRPIWIFGWAGLIFCAIYVALGKGAITADLMLIVVTLGLIVSRFIDIRYLDGETWNNKPGTLKHWRRYSFYVFIIAGALYLLAKFIAQKNWL